jgi:hypothetical protein
MRNRGHKCAASLSLPDILREVKQTVSVYLNETGIENMRGTPYLRDNEFIACRRIIDDTNPNYLFAEVRYYKNESKLPKYTYLSIPHCFVKFMVSDTTFHGKEKLLGSDN